MPDGDGTDAADRVDELTEQREEFRQRATKALANEHTNELSRGYLAAWAEVLQILEAQDAMAALARGDAPESAMTTPREGSRAILGRGVPQ